MTRTTTTPATREQLRTMRAENLAASEQLELIAAEHAKVCAVWGDMPGDMHTIRHGRLMIKALAKSAERLAAKFRSASARLPARREPSAGSRSYPKFTPGESTAEYLARFATLNGQALGFQMLPYDLSAYLHPCTLYEGGAIDFEPIEQPADAPELSADALQPVAIVSALTSATLGTVPRHVADQVSELIASATTAAVIEQANEATSTEDEVYKPAARAIWFPSMTPARLNRLLSKPVLSAYDFEALKDFRFFILNHERDAIEKGFFDQYQLDQKEPVFLLKNKYWLTNINSRLCGDSLDRHKEPDECEPDQAPELATVDACSEASASTCEASSTSNAPSTPHVVYSQLKTGDAFRLYPQGDVYIKTRGGHRPGRGGKVDRAYEGQPVYRWYGDERDQAPAVSTPAPAVDTAPAPAAPTFQTIIGKSGNWCARFRRLPDGDHVLEFSTRPHDWSIYVYKTGRDRMAALQAMARQADQDAETDDDDQDDPQTERERRLNAFDAMTATATDVQAMGAEYVAQLLEDLEDINYHTEGLILQALAAGREDLAARARANLREHLAAGYLTDALRLDRQAIGEALRQSAEPDPTRAPTHTPSSAPTSAPGYTPPAPDHHQQTAPVPNLADKVPRAVGADSGPASNPPSATAPGAPAPTTEASADESEPEFTRTPPQPFDMLAMIAAGLAPADFVGLGIVYSGDRANPSGRGAITDVQPCSWYKYTVTVTLEDGRQSRLNPVSFTDHLGNRFRTDFKRHGAPYLAELAAARLAIEAADKAAKQAAADDKARQRRELPQQWPQLKAYEQGGKLWGCTLAAHNIRVLLKEKFPKVKFSVKSDKFSGGDSISIRWTDGPSAKSVEEISNMFEAGSFNGMEDIYEYSHSTFRDLFGDAKYIHVNRDHSDAAIAQAIEALYLNTEGRPTVEDYRKARGMFDYHENRGAIRRLEQRLDDMGDGFQK